jgi:hypothetical protein
MNVKTILGLGALGGVVYLATNKSARTKTKKAIGLSDGGKYDVVIYKSVKGETPKIKYNPFTKYYEADFLSHTDYYLKLQDAKEDMDNADFVIKKIIKKRKN